MGITRPGARRDHTAPCCAYASWTPGDSLRSTRSNALERPSSDPDSHQVIFHYSSQTPTPNTRVKLTLDYKEAQCPWRSPVVWRQCFFWAASPRPIPHAAFEDDFSNHFGGRGSQAALDSPTHRATEDPRWPTSGEVCILISETLL